MGGVPHYKAQPRIQIRLKIIEWFVDLFTKSIDSTAELKTLPERWSFVERG